MDNLSFLIAGSESYEEVLTLGYVVEYIHVITSALALVILALYLYILATKIITSKTGASANLYFDFITQLVLGILWGWITAMNSAIAWASPDGGINTLLMILAPICTAICGIVAFLEWLRTKKISKLAEKISIVLVNPGEEGELRDCDIQPFIYPYREGKGEGKADASVETEAVVAGSNA